MTFLSVFIITYTDILDFSKVSFYNYVSNGVFEFSHLDLTRMVRYEKKKNTNWKTRKEREIRIAIFY